MVLETTVLPLNYAPMDAVKLSQTAELYYSISGEGMQAIKIFFSILRHFFTDGCVFYITGQIKGKNNFVGKVSPVRQQCVKAAEGGLHKVKNWERKEMAGS